MERTYRISEGYSRGIVEHPFDDLVFDVSEYIASRLPISYPFGGIRGWLRHGLAVRLWYAGDRRSVKLSHRAEFQQYGSAGTLEYRGLVSQRTDGGVTVDLDRITGNARWMKLQFLLAAAGVPAAQVTRYFPEEDEDDLLRGAIVSDFPDGVPSCDAVVVGGASRRVASVICDSLGKVQGGRIVRWQLGSLGKQTVLLTGYAYGDLSEVLGEVLASTRASGVFFLGSCGSITTKLARGDIVIPSTVRCSGGSWEVDDQTVRCHLDGAVPTKVHHSVLTPLEETGLFVSHALRDCVSTVDCEAAWLLKGLRTGASGMSEPTPTSIVLFVTDEAWRARKSLSQLDYANKVVSNARTAGALAVRRAIEKREVQSPSNQ